MGQAMPQGCICCCCRVQRDLADTTDTPSNKDYVALAEHVDSSGVALLYEPPHELATISTKALQRQQSRFADFPFSSSSSSSSTRQDGYPPPFFKRLDKYIKDNGFRARDVFMAIDHDNDHIITVDELVSGLDRIEFKISKREERMLREWIQQIVGHDLTFKDFTLALKQRASLTSPQRISVLKLAKS